MPLPLPALLSTVLMSCQKGGATHTENALAGTGDVGAIPVSAWQVPPRDALPMVRWWWPGGSVEADVLTRQLQVIQRAGFGAVEVQPLLLGLSEADLAADPLLRGVGTAAFQERVIQAAAKAAAAGLAFDLTLGSGWPGGLPTTPQNAERQLLMATLELEGPVTFEGPLPPPPEQSYRRTVERILDVLGPPDTAAELVAVLAAQVTPTRDGIATLSETRDITANVQASSLRWEVPPGDWCIFAFYTNSTEHFVMGGAYPGAAADARVVDHLSQRGADALLDGYVVPTLDALPAGQVRGVFMDSFELMGELPFTFDFRALFLEHTGYDLTPHLPLVFRRGGEAKYAESMDLLGRRGGPRYRSAEPDHAARIREDYEAVRQTLFEDEFVGHFAQWAHARSLEFRLQAHGGYSDYLDTYALADIPESEGLFGGGSFDFLKLAASAAHVMDRRWVSSEAFITLRLFKTRLSVEEMRLLAGRAYSAGINRLVFHGAAYPYQRADGRAWYPFPGGFGRNLAGPLPISSNFDAAFLETLPDFNRFLARLSVAMSQGDPSAEIAWLRASPSYPDVAGLEIGRVKPGAGESSTTQSLRARGLVHDRISRRMLANARAGEGDFEVGARTYQALILDPLPVAEPALVERVVALAEAGIPVFALGELPARAPGLRDARARDQRVLQASKALAMRVLHVRKRDDLVALLSQHVIGDLVEPLPGEQLTVSLERRQSQDSDIVLLFNESWSPTTAHLRFTRTGGVVTCWDPRSGERSTLRERAQMGDVLSIELDAAASLVLTVGPPVPRDSR